MNKLFMESRDMEPKENFKPHKGLEKVSDNGLVLEKEFERGFRFAKIYGSSKQDLIESMDFVPEEPLIKVKRKPKERFDALKKAKSFMEEGHIAIAYSKVRTVYIVDKLNEKKVLMKMQTPTSNALLPLLSCFDQKGSEYKKYKLVL